MTKEKNGKTFSATRFPFLSVTVGINGNLTHMSDRLKELSAQTYTNSKGHPQFFVQTALQFIVVLILPPFLPVY